MYIIIDRVFDFVRFRNRNKADYFNSIFPTSIIIARSRTYYFITDFYVWGEVIARVSVDEHDKCTKTTNFSVRKFFTTFNIRRYSFIRKNDVENVRKQTRFEYDFE